MQDWRLLYNLFDHKRRLEASDMDLFVNRPGAVAEQIAEDLRAQLEPDCKWVVCGSMGSGKSSELVRLGKLLQEQYGVIGLDLPLSTLRVDRLTPAEVLFLIGAAAVKAAGELWGLELPQAAVTQLGNAFRGVLSDQGRDIHVLDAIQGVALLGVNVFAPGSSSLMGAVEGAVKTVGATLGGTVHRRPVLPGGMTRPLKEGEADLERLREAVDTLLVEVARYRAPVILVDGLDKVQDLKSIRDLFTTTRILCSPSAPVIYTGPITLMVNTEYRTVGGAFQRASLSNVIVHPPSPDWVVLPEEKITQGLEVMRQIIIKRLDRVHLKLEEVFEAGAIDELILASGGLLRDLVHLVNRSIRWTLQARADQILVSGVHKAIEEIRKEYEVTLNTRRVDELRHVREKGEPSGAESVSNELLIDGYVLPYANGRVWFEPHPILRGLRPGL